MAVELAKVSLWLTTMDGGRPLSFLDHHLKCGNSLIGADVKRLGDSPLGKQNTAVSGQGNLFIAKFRAKLPEMLSDLFQIMERETRELEDVAKKKKCDAEVEMLARPFITVANTWVSMHYGVRCKDYPAYLMCPEDALASDAQVAEELACFTWPLEFPEVFFDRSGKELPFSGFDLVIGNPPYLGQKGNKLVFEPLASSPSCGKYFEGKMDLWYFFAEVGLDLCKTGGHLSFIATEYWTSAEGASKLRTKVLNDSHILSVHYFNGSVFSEAPGIHSQIFLLKKEDGCPTSATSVYSLPDRYRVGNLVCDLPRIETRDFDQLPPIKQATLPSDGSYFTFKRSRPSIISLTGAKWVTLDQVFDIRQGVVPGFDKISGRLFRLAQELGLTTIEPGAPVFVVPADFGLLGKLRSRERDIIRHFSYAESIGAFEFIGEANHRLIYSSTETVDDISDFSHIADHLLPYRALLETRRETANGQKPWFHLHWPRTQELFESPKIVSVRMTPRPRFAFVRDAIYFDLAVNVLVAPMLSEEVLKRCSLVLNSGIVAQWLRDNGKMKGEMFQVDKGPLEKVPIPRAILENTPLSAVLDTIWERRTKERLSDGDVISLTDQALEQHAV
jgi:hypothetical protein